MSVLTPFFSSHMTMKKSNNKYSIFTSPCVTGSLRKTELNVSTTFSALWVISLTFSNVSCNFQLSLRKTDARNYRSTVPLTSLWVIVNTPCERLTVHTSFDNLHPSNLSLNTRQLSTISPVERKKSVVLKSPTLSYVSLCQQGAANAVQAFAQPEAQSQVPI